MLRSWGKSSPKIPPSSSSSSSSSSQSQSQSQSSISISSNKDKDKDKEKRQIFRCSSFKDIENLCLELDGLDTNNDNVFLKRQSSAPRSSVFQRVLNANTLIRQWPTRSEGRIVVYYTTLRVVRPTFESCRSVLSILHGFRVAVDQRDLAMDSGFMSELRGLLGLKQSDNLGLPRVFIGGRYIGGADEVMHLHEMGDLKKLIAGLHLAKPATCRTCAGYRFILCAQCSGSRKVYSHKTNTGFRTCVACNENGLIRCPHCSSPPPSKPLLS